MACKALEYACECTIERLKKLAALHDAAKELVAHFDLEMFAALKAALKALEVKD